MERFCQSFIPYDGDSEYFRFIVECSKKAVSHLHELGHTIVLYTNIEGARLFANCMYDCIIIPNNAGKLNYNEFFASIKFEAYEREPLETIFIDNDIIITNNECIDKIVGLDCDIVCQQIDIDYSGYIRPRENLLPVICDFFRIDKLMSVANNGLNCGLVKFNNQLLKRKYIADRKNMIKLIIREGVFQKLKRDKTFNWELFIEQWYLLNLCIVERYSFLTLDKANGEHFVDSLGYFHFTGNYATKTVQYLNEIYLSRICPNGHKRIIMNQN